MLYQLSYLPPDRLTATTACQQERDYTQFSDSFQLIRLPIMARFHTFPIPTLSRLDDFHGLLTIGRFDPCPPVRPVPVKVRFRANCLPRLLDRYQW